MPIISIQEEGEKHERGEVGPNWTTTRLVNTGSGLVWKIKSSEKWVLISGSRCEQMPQIHIFLKTFQLVSFSHCRLCVFTHKFPQSFSLLHHLSPLCTVLNVYFHVWITTEFRTSVICLWILVQAPYLKIFNLLCSFPAGQCILII